MSGITVHKCRREEVPQEIVDSIQRDDEAHPDFGHYTIYQEQYEYLTDGSVGHFFYVMEGNKYIGGVFSFPEYTYCNHFKKSDCDICGRCDYKYTGGTHIHPHWIYCEHYEKTSCENCGKVEYNELKIQGIAKSTYGLTRKDIKLNSYLIPFIVDYATKAGFYKITAEPFSRQGKILVKYYGFIPHWADTEYFLFKDKNKLFRNQSLESQVDKCLVNYTKLEVPAIVKKLSFSLTKEYLYPNEFTVKFGSKTTGTGNRLYVAIINRTKLYSVEDIKKLSVRTENDSSKALASDCCVYPVKSSTDGAFWINLVIEVNYLEENFVDLMRVILVEL